MSRTAPGAEAAGGARRGLAAYAPYVILILAVWLGWRILIAPVIERAPPGIAIYLAPSSPMVLRRAAESELAARRFDNAEDLARRALRAAPFDARALSVAGMAVAERDRALADEILTLAGNWSLRHDPSHAWLMDERLRRADYGSAFAHADTLARRREDIQPQIFSLFATAARLDSRSLPPLLDRLAASPPWRTAFFKHLYADPEGDAVLAALAVGLQGTKAPLDDVELGRLYSHWLQEGRVDAIRTIRARLDRPSMARLVVDGDFAETDAQPPFAWVLGQAGGLIAAVMEDDRREGQTALRVEFDGFTGARAARQLMLLSPGSYRLSMDMRVEGADVANPGVAWRIACSRGGLLADLRPSGFPADGGWKRFETRFDVTAACPGQWLILETLPGDRRSAGRVSWHDKVTVELLTP